MADHIDVIKAALSAICEVWDGRIDDPPDRAFLRIDEGISLPQHVVGRRRAERQGFGVVCVNNNPAGARLLADRVRHTLDALPVASYRVRVTDTGPVLEDVGDPTNWRWSCTVNAAITTI